MYAKRIQIINYGPISNLDLELPFEGEVPKPVVLVGENGSGKSILLSHIVNGLMTAKDRAFPESPEVQTGKVFKIRSSSYIRSGRESSFGRVDFENELFASEILLSHQKREYEAIPTDINVSEASVTWDRMDSDLTSFIHSSVYDTTQTKLQEILSRNCVLYFPPNRFEEPAWLNEENLEFQAEHIPLSRFRGSTRRRLIDYSSLRDNQNWLFDIAYDQSVFEGVRLNVLVPVDDSGRVERRLAIVGHSGNATRLYNAALGVVQAAIGGDRYSNFEIGRRLNRVVSLVGANGRVVPNVFQLSSGETALLSLFLSILRDFDLSGAPFANIEEVRGVAVVDEIDLHLHAVHQREILPSLMAMFPKVQFIVTTHSPLFVLGMAQEFGEDGFAVYRMPHGQQISPEEFSEFASAYEAFAATRKFSDEVRSAVLNAQVPILYVEGTTDVKYIRKASEFLGKEHLLERIDVKDGGGTELKNTWSAMKNLSVELVPRKVLILHDCDFQGPAESNGNRFRLKIPIQTGNPIDKGIENLFGKDTLEKARTFKPAFIDVSEAHPVTIRGITQTTPATWTVNENEKTNLCDWLCENGTAADFQYFNVIFDMLEEVLGASAAE